MGAHVSVPLYQRTARQRYALEGARCTKCESVLFPPRAVCSTCGKGDFTPFQLSGQGEVYSYTVIAAGGAPPEFMRQVEAAGEYAVAVIALKEGPRIVAQLVDVDLQAVAVGMPVEAVFRRIYDEEGVNRYGFKFRPVPPQ